MKTSQDSPESDIQIGLMTKAWAEAQNISCDYFDEIESTNTQAKIDAFNGLDPLQIYLTDFQSQGKGRHDRKWTSPKKGSSLLSSWSFLCTKPASPFITSIIGLGLYNAARTTWPEIEWALKAPNDLYVGPKKMAGLLVESVSQGNNHRLIIGLGLNVFSHPESVNTSTHLFQELKNQPLLGEDWVQFLDRFLFEMTLIVPEAHLEPNPSLQRKLLYTFNQNKNLSLPYSDFKTLTEDLWR